MREIINELENIIERLLNEKNNEYVTGQIDGLLMAIQVVLKYNREKMRKIET